jgi:hypothetical protein
MFAHRRALILPYPFGLLPTGAVFFDMYTVRLVGGVVAALVVGEVIYKHGNNIPAKALGVGQDQLPRPEPTFGMPITFLNR